MPCLPGERGLATLVHHLPVKARNDQDDVDTDVLGVVRVAISDPAARRPKTPITAPLTLRPDTRTKAQRRTADLLNTVISGRSSQLKLWDHLVRQWGLAPTDLATRRWNLFQAVLTQAAEAEADWNRATPRKCGAGPRTPLEHCTARDTCHAHRSHLMLWQDALERFTDYLHDVVPVKAAETVNAEPRTTRRRSAQK